MSEDILEEVKTYLRTMRLPTINTVVGIFMPRKQVKYERDQSETVEVLFFMQKIKTGETKVIKFISENWQLITFVSTCMIYLGRQVLATRKGIRALLRADLIRLYNKYHDDLGYCPIYVKQSLEDEYREYHALKGNGVGTNLYEALMALPTEPKEGE